MKKIEKASVDDAEEILALQKRAFRQEAELYGDHEIQPLTVTLDETIEEFKKSFVLKLMHDGKITGSVRGRVQDGICMVGKLIVEPRMQNRGLGAALMKELEKHLPECRKFRLVTGYKSENNKHLYQKLGYRITGTKKINDKVSMVEMEKVLF